MSEQDANDSWQPPSSDVAASKIGHIQPCSSSSHMQVACSHANYRSVLSSDCHDMATFVDEVKAT